MADKNKLPIKLFEKRKIDERRTEGGGDGSLPSFVMEIDALETKVNSFMPVLENAIKSFDTREESRQSIPSTINVEIDDRAIAKSHRRHFRNLFNVNDKENIIAFSESNSVVIKIDNKEDGELIHKNFTNFTKNLIGLSAVIAIEEFEPIIEAEINSENDTLKVNLLNYIDFEINSVVKSAFRIFCKEKGISVSETDYSPELIIFKVNNASKVIVDELS